MNAMLLCWNSRALQIRVLLADDLGVMRDVSGDSLQQRGQCQRSVIGVNAHSIEC